MFKFAFGLTTGVIVGVGASVVAAVIAAIVIEDSPEIQKMCKEIILEITEWFKARSPTRT